MSSSFEKLRRQVESILESNGIHWTPHGPALAMRFSSVIVHVHFEAWGHQALIRIRSDVIRGVSVDRLTALSAVNDLNCQMTFGRWAYYEADQLVVLEYDLLGDDLQEPEFMTALMSLARRADYHDEPLEAVLGGARSFD